MIKSTKEISEEIDSILKRFAEEEKYVQKLVKSYKDRVPIWRKVGCCCMLLIILSNIGLYIYAYTLSTTTLIQKVLIILNNLPLILYIYFELKDFYKLYKKRKNNYERNEILWH